MFKPCDVLESLGHFNSIVVSLVCILMKQRAVCGEKCPLKTPANAISDTRIFKMFPNASAPQELVLLVRVPKPPTIHYQPAIKKCFDSPESLSNLAILLTFKALFPVVYTDFPKHVKSWKKTWIGLLENVNAKGCFICEFLAVNN